MKPVDLDELLALKLRTGRDEGLVLGRTADKAFEPYSMDKRTQKAWKDKNLNRITLHKCRHAFASLMIAAGVNAKALSTYMGTPISRSCSTAAGT